MRKVEGRDHLTKVLSTKLSIEDYDSIRKIAKELFLTKDYQKNMRNVWRV
jgi:hypothetical protein